MQRLKGECYTRGTRVIHTYVDIHGTRDMIKRATTPFCFLLEILFPAQNIALFVKRSLKVKHTEEYRSLKHPFLYMSFFGLLHIYVSSTEFQIFDCSETIGIARKTFKLVWTYWNWVDYQSKGKLFKTLHCPIFLPPIHPVEKLTRKAFKVGS